MMRPDGTWVCPICQDGSDRTAASTTCWHDHGPALGGCSTWYGGRLLHLNKDEVEWLKANRNPPSPGMGGTCDHLVALGFARNTHFFPGKHDALTGEGDNLCRHLWGFPVQVAADGA